MSSEADPNASQQSPDESDINPRSEGLSSKFLRKTKFLQSLTTSPPDASSVAGVSSLHNQDVKQEPSPEPAQPLGNPQTTKIKDGSSTPPFLESVPSPRVSYAISPLASDVGASDGRSPPPETATLEWLQTDLSPFEAAGPSSFPSLSQDELDEAKSLVLDLLGWGVDPEYLVTTGLTPAVLFRVFTDLNLRLPNNLEMTDDLKSVAYPGVPPAEVAPVLN